MLPDKDYATLGDDSTDFNLGIAYNPDYVDKINRNSKDVISKNIDVDGHDVQIFHTEVVAQFFSLFFVYIFY